ncbi:MAG: hypothetical protein ACC707_17650 [Thiohalomonadales bacterium]
MSAPSHRIRQAEHISYGLLAINAIDALEKLIQKNELTDSDYTALSKASVFLVDIANGADLVTKASYHGHNSLASMNALDVAIGPLEQLQDLVQDKKEIASILRQLADKLQTIAESKQPIMGNDEHRLLSLNKFFEGLNNSLVREMTRSRQKLGSSRSSNSRNNIAIG